MTVKDELLEHIIKLPPIVSVRIRYYSSELISYYLPPDFNESQWSEFLSKIDFVCTEPEKLFGLIRHKDGTTSTRDELGWFWSKV